MAVHMGALTGAPGCPSIKDSAPAVSKPFLAVSVSGLPDPAWEFRGYHPWNAYCGRALAPGSAGPRASVHQLPRPEVAGPLDPQPDADQAGEPPVVAAFRRGLHEMHRVAEHLDRLRLDDRFTAHQHALPPELHHKLADALEVLACIRDGLPAGDSHGGV